MLTTKELQTVSITNLEEGREFIAEINAQLRSLLYEMQREGNIKEWQALSNQRYDLVKARRRIQSIMQSMVKEKKNVANR